MKSSKFLILCLCIAFLPVVLFAQDRALSDKICDTPENLSGAITLSNSTSLFSGTSIAWDGEAYGAVWSDESDGYSNIYYARIAADGTVLVNPVNITVNNSNDSYYLCPCLIWNGQYFGMVFFFGEIIGTTYTIYFTLFDQNGITINGNITLDSRLNEFLYHPELVWNGSEFAACWLGTHIYFRRVSATGSVIGSVVSVTTQAGFRYTPSMVSNDTGYTIAYMESRSGDDDIYLATLTADGTVVLVDEKLTTSTEDDTNPSLVWNGSTYAITYFTVGTGLTMNHFTIFNSAVYSFSTAVLANSDLESVLYWNGAEYALLTTNNNLTLSMNRIGRDGSYDANESILLDFVGGSPGIKLAYSHRCIASGRSGYGLVYSTSAPDATRFISIGCHGDTTPPPCPSNLQSPEQSGASITLNWQRSYDTDTDIAYYSIYRDGIFVGRTTSDTWTDMDLNSDSSYNYYVTATNAAAWESSGCASITVSTLPTGECIFDNLLPLRAIGTGLDDNDGLSIVWDGDAYGVVWAQEMESNEEIFFARVAPDGLVLEGPVILTFDAADQSYPTIAWNGFAYGIAWHDNRSGNYDVYFQLTDLNGSPLGPPLPVSVDPALQRFPSLAATPYGFGITWQDARNGNYDVMFAFLDPLGMNLSGDIPITSDVYPQYLPQLVWADEQFGITWEDSRWGDGDVYFTRIDLYGTISPAIAIANDTSEEKNPSIVWTGVEFGVSWQDDQLGHNDIFLQRLDASGSSLGDILRITTNSAAQTRPSLSWNGRDYGLVWNDSRSGTDEIYGCRISTDGTKIDPDTLLTQSGHSIVNFPRTLAANEYTFGLLWITNSRPTLFYTPLGCMGDTTPPSCPASPVVIERTSDTITLAWGESFDEETGLSHYEIYKDGAFYEICAEEYWIDVSFDPAYGPEYWITAVNALDLSSPECDSVHTADSEAPTCPGSLVATAVSTNSVTFEWTPAWDGLSGVKEYQVYRNGYPIAIVGYEQTMYTDNSLVPDTTFSYTVEAIDYSGNHSANCQVLWISTAPITLKMYKNSDRINADLDWTDVKLNEYTVYRSTSPQWATEHERVPVNRTRDSVLNDGVKIWYYYIQQRGM